MGNFMQSVQRVFKNAGKAFKDYPVVIASALVLAAAAIFSIYLDYGEQSRYELALSALRYASGFGAAFGLAALTWARTRKGTSKAFLRANLMALAAAVGLFIILYFFSAVVPEEVPWQAAYDRVLHPMATLRSTVAIFLSFLAFILLAAYPEEESDFARSLTMALKAFFQALLYGLVILAGASAVAGAFQALLYPEMTSKIYGYIAVGAGFMAFTIFLGYFPDFTKGVKDPRRDEAQNQPRFLAVLLELILVPIMLALTLVLLLWAARTVMQGMNTNFTRLYSIATGFATVGILLHILITHSPSGLARFYRRVFPFAVLLILAFEAWALYIQISHWGMKTEEYVFGIVWIIALLSSLLLILRQSKGHPLIVYVITALSVLAVLPLAGVGDLPPALQMARLERLLKAEGMLQNDRIVPAAQLPSLETRRKITDSVNYLVYEPFVQYPQWFDKVGLREARFESIMGFSQVFSEEEPGKGGEKEYTILQMQDQVLDITGYTWFVLQGEGYMGSNKPTAFQGSRGNYTIAFNSADNKGTPKVVIRLNDQVILEEDFASFLKAALQKYPLGSGNVNNVPLEDMRLVIQKPELEVLFVFRSIELMGSSQDHNTSGYLGGVYLKEMP